MKIDGVSYNHEWAKTKTEAEFVKEFSGDHMDHIYPGDKDKVGKLKAAHALLLKTPLEDEEGAPAVEAVVKQPSLATNNPGQPKA